MPRLSVLLGGPRLFIKRDDCTGLVTGGNKSRKLEFLVGAAIHEKADLLVTQGAAQSNHVRQTAADACRIGMKCHVLLERRVPGRDDSYEQTGDVPLDNVFGATHEFRPAGLDMNTEAETVAAHLRAEGHRPYFIPGGGSNATGALGYANCAQEIADQSRQCGQGFDWLVMATGIPLDPVYSAKGMAGLIGLVRQGFYRPQDNVLFLHTGGSAALFAYQDQILASLT